MIKLNTVGRSLEGDGKGKYIMVQTDFENTGGYLILTSTDPSFCSEESYDNGVENYEDLLDFFKESKWKIKWKEK